MGPHPRCARQRKFYVRDGRAHAGGGEGGKENKLKKQNLIHPESKNVEWRESRGENRRAMRQRGRGVVQAERETIYVPEEVVRSGVDARGKKKKIVEVVISKRNDRLWSSYPRPK